MTGLEIIAEHSRFCDHSFGFWAERICSDFNQEGVPIPKKRLAYMRPSVNIMNLFIPVGGGERGTIFVQQAHCDPGSCAPTRVVRSVVTTFLPKVLKNFREAAIRASDPKEPWLKRIRIDADG